MKELISVVIPIYNQGRFLEKCLKSIVTQTYDNYEVILVNDGSTDESLDICRNYEIFPNVTLVKQPNKGVSVARNVGISLATGTWVTFIDGDDYVDEKYLETLYENVDDSIDILVTGCEAFDEKKRYVDYFFDQDFDCTSSEDKIKLYAQLLNRTIGQPGNVCTACGVPWGKLYRKSFLLDNKLVFSPELLRMQDNIFNMYAFNVAKKIRYVNTALYYYRLEHIVNYSNSFNPLLHRILTSVRKERYKFFVEYYREDMMIQKLYALEAFEHMCWYFDSFLYHPENKIGKKKRIEMLVKMFDVDAFRDCFNLVSYKDVYGKKGKLFLFSLRFKMWFFVDLLHEYIARINYGCYLEYK